MNEIHAKINWFKQSLENTQRIVSTYMGETEFHNEFNNNHRFSLDYENGKKNLEIGNVQISDSAVYHCISCVGHQVSFLATVHIAVKEHNVGLQIDQPLSETVTPGQSLRLRCSVHFGTCNGQNKVYWFAQSGESESGVIHSHRGGDEGQCERAPNASSKSCSYSLNIHNVSSAQVGTYYCAVEACGQVLFGNGTIVKSKLHVKFKKAFKSNGANGELSFLGSGAIFLVVLLFCTLILNGSIHVLLMFMSFSLLSQFADSFYILHTFSIYSVCHYSSS